MPINKYSDTEPLGYQQNSTYYVLLRKFGAIKI